MVSKQSRTFGSVLRDLREDRRLSVRSLATAAGLNASSVSRLENDEMGPSDDTVRRLAKVLKTSYRELSTLAGGNLPNFAPYLRAKFDLSHEAIAELEGHFAAVTKQHAKPDRGRGSKK